MRTVVHGLVAHLDRHDPFLVVARLTLLTLLVNTQSDPVLLVAAAAATVVLFFQERLIRSPWPWLGMAGVLGWTQWTQWWLVDDHSVVVSYWLLGIGLSRFATRPSEVLAVTARLLIGLVFALAFTWKLLSSQYTSGSFFEYTLVRDHRFGPVIELTGGVDPSRIDQERSEIADFTITADPSEAVEVNTGERVERLARVFTWFGVFTEGSTALAFLAPLRGRLRLARPVALVTFCLTTYAVVPVAGFGVLLMTLGLAQSDEPRIRAVYLVAAAAVFVWNSILAGVIL